jgi:hypothetical protein
VSRHSALGLFIILSVVSLLAAAAADMRSAGGLKGDEATYVGMAASLAHDADFVFTASDYQRFRLWYSQGPEGIFLKQAPFPRRPSWPATVRRSCRCW